MDWFEISVCCIIITAIVSALLSMVFNIFAFKHARRQNYWKEDVFGQLAKCCLILSIGCSVAIILGALAVASWVYVLEWFYPIGYDMLNGVR